MLVLTRKQDEAIRINDDIRIVVSRMSGNRIRLAIDAPQSMCILREELWLELAAAAAEEETNLSTLTVGKPL